MVLYGWCFYYKKGRVATKIVKHALSKRKRKPKSGILSKGTFAELRLVTILIVKVENMENSVISSVQKDSHHIPQRGFVKKVGRGWRKFEVFGGIVGVIPHHQNKTQVLKRQVRNILSRERSHIPPTGICFFPRRVIVFFLFFVNLIWVKYDSKFPQESL